MEEPSMLSRTVTSTIFLCAGWLSRLHAQDPGLLGLNFNIGGGLAAPLNPTARYAGMSGNGTTGVGYNFDKYNSVEGDFLWIGLPPNLPVARGNLRPDLRFDLFALTGQYRFHLDNIGESPAGL